MRLFKKRKSYLAALMTAVFVLSPLPALKGHAANEENQLQSVKVQKNIFVDGVDVSEMTGDELKSALQQKADACKNSEVNLRTDFGDVNVKLSDIGYRDNADQIANSVLAVGNSGNVLSRYRERKSLEKEPMEFKLEKTISASALETVIRSNLGEAMSSESEYQLIKHSDGTVNVLLKDSNTVINYAGTADEIEKFLDEGQSGKLSVTAVKGNPDDEMTNALNEIHDLLGTYTTDYNGPSGRMQNVERASELMNGKVLFPGDVISVYRNIEPIEVDNGYAMGHQFVNNKIVDGVGGGVCQVSTTFYVAALYAELEIVQRDCHSLRVSYVPIAMDATLAGGVIDLKVKNNLSAPIYIESVAYDGTLTFNIYGKETRPANRKVELEAYQTATIDMPPDVVTEDPTLKPGEEKITEKGGPGYVGELWKYVYVDGEEVDSVLINRSNYSATPNYVSRNSQPPSEEPTTQPPTEAPKPTEQKPTEKPTEKPTQQPATQQPTQQPDTQQQNTQEQQPQQPEQQQPQQPEQQQPQQPENPGDGGQQ